MNRYLITLFSIVLFLAFFSSAFSQVSVESESTTESWYTYWSMGYASVSYPNELQEMIDFLIDQPEVIHVPISIDILGFYWHISPKMIGGVIVNGTADRFSVEDVWIQINQFNYGASMMYYPGQAFGSGIVLRADIGLASLSVSNSDGAEANSETGFGMLAGLGWSFDFGGTRLLLNVNYAYRGVENETYNTLGFSVGGLF